MRIIWLSCTHDGSTALFDTFSVKMIECQRYDESYDNLISIIDL